MRILTGKLEVSFQLRVSTVGIVCSNDGECALYFVNTAPLAFSHSTWTSPWTTLVPIPTGVSPIAAAGAPVAAVTARGSIIPYVYASSQVFINGDSGGVGTYGIQIAKQVGAHVTVSCSTRNVDLCRSLGAGEVLDYTKRPLSKQLQDVADRLRPFDHIVDNVFSDPALYFQGRTCTSANAKFVEVASGPELDFLRFALGALLWPSCFGGGRRKLVFAYADINNKNLAQIAKGMADGDVKPVTDQVFAMEDTVEAFRRLKTCRATGKVIGAVDGRCKCLVGPHFPM